MLPEDDVYTLLKESFIVTHSNQDSKSVRLSNMWILYCGITSGQCKTLRHYLTTYQKPDSPDSILSSLFFPTTFMMSEEFDDPFQPLSSDLSHRSVTPLTQPIYTESISQDILKDPVKVLYLFQCFQEAQDYVLCKLLSKSFDDGVIDINNHSFLPHQVVSLGFFLSRSQRKWKKLNLHKCYLRDNDMSIIHQYLCGDKANTQEITKIDLSNNDLTGGHHHISLLTSSVTFSHKLYC